MNGLFTAVDLPNCSWSKTALAVEANNVTAMSLPTSRNCKSASGRTTVQSLMSTGVATVHVL